MKRSSESLRSRRSHCGQARVFKDAKRKGVVVGERETHQLSNVLILIFQFSTIDECPLFRFDACGNSRKDFQILDSKECAVFLTAGTFAGR